MNYAAIYECDIANGTGCRTSLFVSGCTHHCRGCFNKEAWDFSYGKPYTTETEEYILSTLAQADGLSILGGEPMEPQNMWRVYSLIRRTKDLGKSVWVYTGYTWEELIARSKGGSSRDRVLDPAADVTMAILQMIDVLVDGEFKLEEKDISLRFRGSRNQRILDVQKSLRAGHAVFWEGK